MAPRPLGDMVQDDEMDEFYGFDVLDIGTDGPLMRDRASSAGHEYLIVADYSSGYMLMEPSKACTAEVTGKTVFGWWALWREGPGLCERHSEAFKKRALKLAAATI